MSKEKSQSPVPKKETRVPVQVDFFEAMRAVSEGKKIRRPEWEDKKEYGFLKDTYLQIYRIKEGETKYSFHNWIVSEGDMLALDWEVVKDGN